MVTRNPGQGEGAVSPRVLVCGSRSVHPDEREVLARLGTLGPDVTVVSGGARGADSAGEAAARLGGLRCEVFPAHWARLGGRAGIVRNLQMLNSGIDCVLAFWDGESRGTAHTLAEAKKRGIRVWIVRCPAVPREQEGDGDG